MIHEYVHHLLYLLVDSDILSSSQAEALAQTIEDLCRSINENELFLDSDENERSVAEAAYQYLVGRLPFPLVDDQKVISFDPLIRAVITIPKILRSPLDYVNILSLHEDSTKWTKEERALMNAFETVFTPPNVPTQRSRVLIMPERTKTDNAQKTSQKARKLNQAA